MMSTEIIAMFHNLDERMNRLEAMMEQMIKMVASTIQSQTELGKRIDQLNEKIDSINVNLSEKIDSVYHELNSKIDSVHLELNNKIDNVLNEQISMKFKIEIISQEQILTNYKINAFQHTLTSFDKKN